MHQATSAHKGGLTDRRMAVSPHEVSLTSAIGSEGPRTCRPLDLKPLMSGRNGKSPEGFFIWQECVELLLSQAVHDFLKVLGGVRTPWWRRLAQACQVVEGSCRARHSSGRSRLGGAIVCASLGSDSPCLKPPTTNWGPVCVCSTLDCRSAASEDGSIGSMPTNVHSYLLVSLAPLGYTVFNKRALGLG